MTQSTDLTLSNQTGGSFRSELNSILQAIASSHKGSSAPSYVVTGMFWLDDTATPWILKVYDGADWISVLQINATTNAISFSNNIIFSGNNIFQGTIDVNNVLAEGSGGINLQNSAGNTVISIGASGTTNAVFQGVVQTNSLLNTAASTTGRAGLRVQPGTRPTSPENGDVWLEAGQGLYVYFDGATQQLDNRIPINSQSAAYTLVLADANSCIYHPASDTTPRTWTIPANASVAFPIGTAISFDNDYGAGAITVAITSDTLVLVGSAGSTGSRTLAAGGRATAHKVTSTRWRISGTGLT